MAKFWRRLGLLVGLALVIAGVFAGMNRLHILMYGNSRYYQRTKPSSTTDGLVNRKLFSQGQLAQLTKLTHGTQYTGNTGLDAVATHYVYRQSEKNIRNFMGSDGVLQLYSESKMMRPAMVKDAAAFWNQVAGYRIVQVVDSAKASDEVIHDGKTKDKAVGGQQYNGTGIQFFPANWQTKGFSAREDLNNREAILIREIGHALGIPTLGGGKLGENAASVGYITSEVMGVWESGPNRLPANQKGIHSTRMDAAAVALAGISWQHPRRLATKVLTNQQPVVMYNAGRLTVK
ncbi:hypothetical protein [Levilactobacillus tujiorum]|uniref:hypothetical protein n=1 Tax=Levilactobacillus tujiorum TaxID=2912243 RepID=UPI001456E779|nr:hypothetical protein [Levilactobacillus tujiorum]NLR31901.1 hypothetical protein [Levilactobacillus tujiorum]